jgi:hypothetical protein
MPKKAVLSLICICSVILSFAESSEGGLISGEGWGILVSAPKGWVWDRQVIRPQGVEGLFSKEGERYSEFALHISISSQGKKGAVASSLAKFMEEDKAAIAASDTDLVFRDLPAYSPGMEYRFAMRELDEPGKGYYQTLAYYEGEKAFFSFVLSCRSPEERARENGALLELLDSFTYLSKE